MWVDGSESINDDFTADGLDGVDNYGHCARVELFKGLCELSSIAARDCPQ